MLSILCLRQAMPLNSSKANKNTMIGIFMGKDLDVKDHIMPVYSLLVPDSGISVIQTSEC